MRPIISGFSSIPLFACIMLLAAAAPAIAQEPDRNTPPALGPPPTLTLPSLQHATLRNGLPVLLMEKHGVPLVQITLLVNSGSVDDPADLPGLANMTAAMMNEGAGQRDAMQIADAIDFLGAELTVSANFHSTAVRLFTPLSKLDAALDLMGDVSLRPRFDGTELDRLRKDRLTQLVQWRDESRMLATIEFNKLLYGSAHPYGRPEIGTEAALRAFNVNDLRRFHDEHFTAGNATLIVVGDVQESNILEQFERIFGAWKGGSQHAGRVPEARQVVSRTITIVDKPGAAQSEIRIGRIGAERQTGDYYALTVLNTILGGSFTSRLNQNLREKHGFTYGARSTFVFRPAPGPFLAYAAVQTAVTDRALREFMNELNAIMQPVSEEELQRAKNYDAYTYPQNFQSAAQIAGEIEEIAEYHLPDTYCNAYIRNILAVTQDDVSRAAKRYLDPENVAIVIVGDRSVIEQGVRALAIGDIRICDVDDVLGKAPDLRE